MRTCCLEDHDSSSFLFVALMFLFRGFFDTFPEDPRVSRCVCFFGCSGGRWRFLEPFLLFFVEVSWICMLLGLRMNFVAGFLETFWGFPGFCLLSRTFGPFFQAFYRDQ